MNQTERSSSFTRITTGPNPPPSGGGDPVRAPARIGIGPVTRNTVEAALAIAYNQNLRLMLIASRGQVDGHHIGGGYVENWTTDSFVEYVKRRDPANRILICRDHGGPWQHPRERDYSHPHAMASCLKSFETDIQAGFSLLHIDTSLDRNGTAEFEFALDRLLELYDHCHRFAAHLGRTVHFEIGLERQGPDTDHPTLFEKRLERILSALAQNSLPLPAFVVAQTGTMVVESMNVGAIGTAPIAVGYAIQALADSCRRMGVALKAHNVDYLNHDAIRVLRRCGVEAINVAPEFGVAETKALLQLLGKLSLTRERDEFLALAHSAGSWRKWMSAASTSSDLDRAVLGGHYIFGTRDFRRIRSAVERALGAEAGALDAHLVGAVSWQIQRFIAAFEISVQEGQLHG